MPDSTSSASPSALLRYAEAILRLSDDLDAEARRLRAALDAFAATCTEFPTGIDGALADPLHAHARRSAEHAHWVRRVGIAFLQADSGALTPTLPALVAPELPGSLSPIVAPWLAAPCDPLALPPLPGMAGVEPVCGDAVAVDLSLAEAWI